MKVAPDRIVVGIAVLFGAIAAPRVQAGPPADPGSNGPTWTAEQRRHWSFLPPRRAPLPEVRHPEWVRNPIDSFILQGLEGADLAPAPEADRATLIRRLRFDLTGLPPTPDELAAFLADDRPDAYERLVDRLLEGPQYGERWARPWLDLARFAESDGFKSDKTRPDAWRYRDWVVKALNDDMPYDRFVRLQLAGDEVAPGDADAFIATGFNRNWPFEDNNKVPGLNRQLMLDDMTDTTASVFLGLTVACARCHDHKYDPISQEDYYRFQALFAAAAPKDDRPLADPFDSAVHAFIADEHKGRLASARRAVEAVERPYLADLIKDKLAKLPPEVREAFETEPEERSAFQEDLLKKHAQAMAVDPKVMKSAMTEADRGLWESRRRAMDQVARQAPRPLPVASGMTDSGPEAPPVFLLVKGNFTKPGGEVGPGFLSVLAQGDFKSQISNLKSQIQDSATAPTTGRRRALADWIASPAHPLTARVMANRLWQGHFGRGIVATPSDFGTQGAEPTHPELLDWLATEFVARGWSLKALHRLMVTSATYRQSSLSSAETREADPENVWVGRMPRRRLEAEEVRDALLAVSGRLNPAIGGPSVFPDLPPGVQTRGGWTRSASAADRDRRSLYVFVRRNLKYPLFDAFDAPDTNVTCPERNVSVNAPQALMLLNSGLVLDQARNFAGRVLAGAADPGDDEALVDRAYRLALGRSPDASESARGVAFLREQPAAIADRDEIKDAGLPAPTPAGLDRARGAALVDFCHAVLNLNEFVFVD